jgi:hypothetical protein
LAAEDPIHVVCAWIGNTERIAAKHYLQVTEGDFQRATFALLKKHRSQDAEVVLLTNGGKRWIETRQTDKFHHSDKVASALKYWLKQAGPLAGPGPPGLLRKEPRPGQLQGVGWWTCLPDLPPSDPASPGRNHQTVKWRCLVNDEPRRHLDRRSGCRLPRPWTTAESRI